MLALLDDPIGRISLLIGAMSGLTLLLLAAAFTGGTPRQLRRRMLQVSARQVSARQRAAAPGGAARSGRCPAAARRRASSAFCAGCRAAPRWCSGWSRPAAASALLQYVCWTIAHRAREPACRWSSSPASALLASLLSGSAIGLFLPHYLVGRMGHRRVARFIALFPETIDLMVRALRAGLPVTEAIINAGQEIGDPVGTELRGIEAGMRVGRDLDSLLWDIAKRIDRAGIPLLHHRAQRAARDRRQPGRNAEQSRRKCCAAGGRCGPRRARWRARRAPAR